MPGNHILSRLRTFALSFLLVGCSGVRKWPVLDAEVAPGVVLVDVLEAGQPEHYWQYQVQPTTGMVRMIREQSFPDYEHEDLPHYFQQPAGAIEACAKNPQATSPNGEYLAYCKGDGVGPDEFYVAVTDKPGTGTLHHWQTKRGIRGFAWAPNSNSVAILTASGYVGMSPREILAFFSGHPVPHDTVFLDFLDVRTGKIAEYMVRRNVISSFTRILNWGG